MRRSIFGAMVLAAAAAVSMCGGTTTRPARRIPGPIVFTATLSGANEVPPITGAEANGRGNATVTMNVPRDGFGQPDRRRHRQLFRPAVGSPGGNADHSWAHPRGARRASMAGRVVNTGLTPASPSVLDGAGTGNLVFNDRAVAADVAQRIYANPAGFYVNFHSQANGGGVVRGQLTRVQ